MKCPYDGTECDAGADCNERIGCWYLRTLTPETKRGEWLADLQADFEWIQRGRDHFADGRPSRLKMRRPNPH